MQGYIRSYSSTEKSGLIECIDGKKYRFSIIDWLDQQPPYIKQPVIFMKNGNHAVEVTEALDSTLTTQVREAQVF